MRELKLPKTADIRKAYPPVACLRTALFEQWLVRRNVDAELSASLFRVIPDKQYML
jgi:hypothetical protein